MAKSRIAEISGETLLEPWRPDAQSTASIRDPDRLGQARLGCPAHPVPKPFRNQMAPLSSPLRRVGAASSTKPCACAGPRDLRACSRSPTRADGTRPGSSTCSPTTRCSWPEYAVGVPVAHSGACLGRRRTDPGRTKQTYGTAARPWTTPAGSPVRAASSDRCAAFSR